MILTEMAQWRKKWRENVKKAIQRKKRYHYPQWKLKLNGWKLKWLMKESQQISMKMCESYLGPTPVGIGENTAKATATQRSWRNLREEAEEEATWSWYTWRIRRRETMKIRLCHVPYQCSWENLYYAGEILKYVAKKTESQLLFSYGWKYEAEAQ